MAKASDTDDQLLNQISNLKKEIEERIEELTKRGFLTTYDIDSIDNTFTITFQKHVAIDRTV